MVTDFEKSVMQVIRAYSSAVYERDIEAFISLYDPNVRIYDAWDIWEYRAPRNGGADRSLANISRHRELTVTFDDVQTSGSLAFAVVSAMVTYERVSAQGEQLGAIQNRITWVLRASSRLLQIIHEHTSVPVDLQKMKPFLRRESLPLDSVLSVRAAPPQQRRKQ